MVDFKPTSSEALLALSVVRCLHSAGYEAMLVGGCVRDLLLGREPKDYDVATNARPDEVLGLFPRTVAVGAKFGVIVVVGDDAQVEVATYRSESGYSDFRRPDAVTFSDARNDSMRRDFTINGMFMDPLSGSVLDHVNGQCDLQAGVVRAIGMASDRFSEDALRILRALRFASCLGFEIDSQTFDAIRSCRSLLFRISAERIRDELLKGFLGGHPDRFLDMLDATGLLELILPEVSLMKGCDQPPEFHPEGDVYVHTRLMLRHMKPGPSAALAFAVLLHDVGKPPTREVRDRIRFNNHHKVGAEMADAICRRLAFSNEMREKTVAMIARHMHFISLPDMKRSTLRRFFAESFIEDELELHRLDCLGSHGHLDNYDLAIALLQELKAEDETPRLPDPFVTGHDLIALGEKPGPHFKEWLRAVHDAQLEGTVSSREDALRLLREISRTSA